MWYRKLSKQQEWQAKTLNYVKAINAYVAKGIRDGWKKAGKPPKDPDLAHLVSAALAAVRQANAEGKLDELRQQWPPVHAPLIDLLEENGQDIPVVCILNDGSLLARIGSSYEPGRTVRLCGDTVIDEAEMGFFGRCPNRRYFGIVRDAGIEILDGWGGPRVAICPWPTGMEDAPEGFDLSPWDGPPSPSRVIPFPDGKKVLMVSDQGIFVMSPTGARRLLPTKEQMREHFEWMRDEYPNDEPSITLSMEHGAISKDGKLIAVGCQDSTHLVFNDRFELIGNIGNQSEYPHYALFSSDESMIAFNSCHFYNGITIGVPTALLPGLVTRPYEVDERTPIIEDGSRVYAGVSRNDEFIIGDANGYIRGVSLKSEARWQQFIGSSVGDIDISPDGKTLAVSTYAGFIATFRMDAGMQAPHQIGNGNHFEERRWVFWKNEPKPLIW